MSGCDSTHASDLNQNPSLLQSWAAVAFSANVPGSSQLSPGVWGPPPPHTRAELLWTALLRLSVSKHNRELVPDSDLGVNPVRLLSLQPR
jgi:hypothetical protein